MAGDWSVDGKKYQPGKVIQSGLRAAAYWPYLQELRNPGNDCEKCMNPEYGPTLRKAWGCDRPSEPDRPGGDRFIYDLGGTEIDRCPLALMKTTFVQIVLENYDAWKQGITPNNQGLKKETALYRQSMSLCSSLEISSKNWYEKETTKRHKQKRGK